MFNEGKKMGLEKLIFFLSSIPLFVQLDEVLVVENATKYIKHLEERVDSLERRLDSTIGEEDEQSSVVLSEDTKSDSDSDSSLPQILVYISLRDVIISIQCKNHKNIIWETISEVEKQQLSVISFNTMSFGRAELVINILAKVRTSFCRICCMFVYIFLLLVQILRNEIIFFNEKGNIVYFNHTHSRLNLLVISFVLMTKNLLLTFYWIEHLKNG